MTNDISRLSARKLRRLVQREIDGLPPEQRTVAWQNVDNAILSMFLDGIGILRGGGALTLRYPLKYGRVARGLGGFLGFRATI